MSGGTKPPGQTSRRRTRVVFLLERLDTPVTVDELVDELERDADLRAESLGRGASWEDLHELLHDEDLPALDRAGLLTFDDERGIVTDAAAEGEPPVTAAPPRDDVSTPDATDVDRRSVARYHLGVAALCSIVLAVATLDVGPFAAVPSDTVATGLVVVLVLSSVATALKFQA